jgi:hypothetical protein
VVQVVEGKDCKPWISAGMFEFGNRGMLVLPYRPDKTIPYAGYGLDEPRRVPYISQRSAKLVDGFIRAMFEVEKNPFVSDFSGNETVDGGLLSYSFCPGSPPTRVRMRGTGRE